MDNQRFPHASDVIEYLRSQSSSRELCIGAAGYPETHPDAESPEADLQFLQYKINCGSDFIITQICFDASVVKDFIKKCRSVGITVPIIPGIYLPDTYRMLQNVCKICHIDIPENVMMIYEEVKHDEVKFRKVAHEMTVELVNDLLSVDDIAGVHFFSFNKIQPIADVIENCESHFQ